MDATTGWKEQIQEQYGAAARRAATGAKDVTCGSRSGCCGTDEITENLFANAFVRATKPTPQPCCALRQAQGAVSQSNGGTDCCKP